MKQILVTFVLTSLFWFAFFEYTAKLSNEKANNQHDTELSAEARNSIKVENNDTEEPVSTPKPKAQKEDTGSEIKKLGKEKTQTKNVEPALSKQKDVMQISPFGIYGKWAPIESAEAPLEFTKYGTVIQTKYSLAFRHNYSTHENQLKIGHEKMTFKVISDGGIVYLEIYNSSEYSGRYKRVAQSKQINAKVIDITEYQEKIIGKWSPVEGQEPPLEFTKYNTVIQKKYGLDLRNNYSLNNDILEIEHHRNIPIVISEDNENYYLEIYNSVEFSGRYKRTK